MQILLAGDSTVTEQPRTQPYDPGRSYCGWGQQLSGFLWPGVPVRNFALSGLTVESFRAEGRWALLMEALAPGDVVLLQFGHNDQKLPHLQARGAYLDALAAYVAEVRAAGGCPVLVTPVARNSWRANGAYNDLLAAYAGAAALAAHQTGAPLLDLHDASVAWVRALGLQGAKAFFYPGDYTHPNAYGGLAWAEMLAGEVLACNHPDIRPLQAALLHKADWPQVTLPAGRADPVFGWLAPPQPRTDFAAFVKDAPLSRLAALEMAMQGYGYFAVNGEEAITCLPLRAALQNAYLPQDFPTGEGDLNAPVPAGEYRALMLAACRGRNVLPPAAQALPLPVPAGEPLTGAQAVAYALALEAAATGCGGVPGGDPQAYSPAGA